MDNPLVQKLALKLYDGGGDPVEGPLPLMDASNQPDRRAKFVLDVLLDVGRHFFLVKGGSIKIADLQFENWTVNIDPKFVKDGYVYLMRGDHPGLDKKRILY